MAKYTIGVVLMLLALLSQAMAGYTDVKVLTSPGNVKLPHFTAVKVIGDVDVELVGSQSNSNVAIERLSQPLYLKVENEVLTLCDNASCSYWRTPHFLSRSEKLRRNAVVRIDMGDLYVFSYRGEGAIAGSQLRSHMLDVDINNHGYTVLNGQKLGLHKLNVKGEGSVKIRSLFSPSLDINIDARTHVDLEGIAGLSQLNYAGRGDLSLYWINSCKLQIHGADHAHAFIAGVVDSIQVELEDNAKLDAQYLRSREATVETHNKSIAQVWARATLYAAANDSSNIYYFHKPELLNDFHQQDGAILPMVGLDLRQCPPKPEAPQGYCQPKPETSLYDK